MINYDFLFNGDIKYNKQDKVLLNNIIKNGYKPNIYTKNQMEAIDKILLIQKYDLNDDIQKYLLPNISLCQLSYILYIYTRHKESLIYICKNKNNKYIYDDENMYYMSKLIKSKLGEKIKSISKLSNITNLNAYLKMLCKNINKIKYLDDTTFDSVIRRFCNIPYSVKTEKTLMNMINEEIQNNIEDNLIIRQLDIIDIFAEYPNEVKIIYNKNKKTEEVIWSNDMLNNIQINDSIQNIPIESIQKIIVDNKEVYNTKKYKPIKTSDSINIIKEDIKNNKTYQSDKTNLIYKTNLYKEDKIFLEKYLNDCNTSLKLVSDEWYIEFFKNFPIRFLTLDVVDLITKYFNTNKLVVLKNLPIEYLNKPEIISNIRNNGKIKEDKDITKKLRLFNTQNLLEVFNKKDLCQHICDLPQNVLNDKVFIKQLLRSNNVKCFKNNRLVNTYKNDPRFLKQIICKINNIEDVNAYIKFLHIENDLTKKYELCSINSHFIETLTEEEQEVFVIEEMKEIYNETLIKSDKNNIKLQTKFGYIEINYDDEDVLTYFTDNYKHKYEFNDECSKIVIKIAEQYLKNKYAVQSDNIFEIFSEINDKSL